MTLVDFALDDWGGIVDYYEISLVNGYNVPIKVTPKDGTFQKIPTFPYYNCEKLECTGDILVSCPDELSVTSNDTKIACKSSCSQYKDDKHCCKQNYGTLSACEPKQWTTNSAEIFKSSCPKAITYNYDNELTNFLCIGNPITGYEVAFC